MPDSNTPLRPSDDGETLIRAVELLDSAARTEWERAQAEGPLGATYSLAQDLHLVVDFACGLILPTAEGRGLTGLEAPLESSPGDVRGALTEAESLLRSLPIETLPAGASQLLVRLADLIRRANP